MDSSATTRSLGAVMVAATLAVLWVSLAQAVRSFGVLGAFQSAALSDLASVVVPWVVIGLAGLALLLPSWERWVTVALAFSAMAGLLSLSSVGYLVTGLGSFGLSGLGTGTVTLAAGSVLVAVGVVSVLVLRGATGGPTSPGLASTGARAVAVASAGVIAIGIVLLPQWIDSSGSGYGHLPGLLGRSESLLLFQIAAPLVGYLEPVLATAALVFIARRDLLVGAVLAVAVDRWYWVLATVIPGVGLDATIGSYVVVLGVAWLVAVIIVLTGPNVRTTDAKPSPDDNPGDEPEPGGPTAAGPAAGQASSPSQP